MKILLVDDEPELLQSMDDILTSVGHEVILTGTVREAIRYLETGRLIHLIITDLVMPGETGLDLLEFVRANLRYQRIPIVVCSGYARSEAVQNALRLGAKDFLVKPVDKAQLLAKIEKVVTASRRTVLIVSGDQLSRDVLARLAQREGFHAVSVSTGAEALIRITGSNTFAVMTEMSLVDMSGMDLAVAAKERNPFLPVLLITSREGKMSREMAIAAGADGVIGRPFNNLEIARKLTYYSLEPKVREGEPGTEPRKS